MPSLTPGDVLADRFEVLEPLGAGGLAEVYAATDRAAGGEVALKVLHGHLARDAALVERFGREMTVTRGLDAPGIVRAFEAYQHQGRPFFAMERLRGETLAERLRREGKLPPEEARRIALEICRALEVAHRAGVLHRDLKPENVFLTEGGAVKLLDFGQARAGGLERLTAKSEMMGTPGYLAPELLQGHPGDARADLYAVGALLFELLTGRKAFASEDPFRVMKLQAAGEASPRAVDAGVSEADDTLVRRALATDPEQRFASAGQLAAALGGSEVPAAPEVPPALTPGKLDVRAFVGPEGEGQEVLGPLISLLGGRPPPWIRLGPLAQSQFAGHLLVSGASQATADEVARLAAERGLGVKIVPARPGGRWARLLGSNAGWAGVLVGSAALWACESALSTMSLMNAKGLGTPADVLMSVAIKVGFYGVGALSSLFLAAFCFLLVRYLCPVPAIARLDEGDPVALRLLDGIRRRVLLLTERAASAGDSGEALALLARGLESEASTLALTLGEAAAPAPDSEAATLPYGTAVLDDRRDAGIGRLLAVASSLDAALADTATPRPDGLSRALEVLRAEASFVRREAATVGEPP